MSQPSNPGSDVLTDIVDVYIMKSWPAAFNNNDMDSVNLVNVVAMVSTATGDEMVRAFEGQGVGRPLYKVFESVAHWDEVNTRHMVVNSVVAKEGELKPHQVWYLITQFCNRNHLENEKWFVKPHVDAYARRWADRQEQKAEDSEAGRYSPALVPARGDV